MEMRERGGNKWQEEKVLVTQLCLTFCDPTDWRTPPVTARLFCLKVMHKVACNLEAELLCSHKVSLL